jgi:hypothetical protein
MGHDKGHGHEQAGHGHGHGHGHAAKIHHNPVIVHALQEHHHVDMSTFKVPDWKSYKVENVKQLTETKNKLAAKGLKDPWLR